ncbi:MAG: DUF6064 family protein [Thiolinea sp.]
MSELLQFSLLDMTPYDRASWFNLIEGYHQAIWPLQLLVLLLMLGLSVIMPQRVAHAATGHAATRLTLAFLGLGWLWCGGVFQLQYYAGLNWAAPFFGIIFILQGGLLLILAILRRTAAWVSLQSWRGRLGLIMLLVGLFVYPLIGLAEGRTLQQLEIFPLLPAPLTLVTLALLLMLNTLWRYALVVIPVFWALISAAFAWTLGLTEVYFMAGALLLWFATLLVTA